MSEKLVLHEGEMEVMEASQFADVSAVSHAVRFDNDLCTGCGLCAAFCPMEVIAMADGRPQAVAAEGMSRGCETCSGQCPVHAIRIEATAQEGDAPAEASASPMDEHTRSRYREWARVLRDVLGLRWHPVAITLVRAGDPLPDVPMPEERLRYCQALYGGAARASAYDAGKPSRLPRWHLHFGGSPPFPPNSASGELYILFHKLDSVEAAQRMVAERPSLPPR